MVNFIIKFLARQFPNWAQLCINFRCLAIDHGQWRSIKAHNAIDANSDLIPWYTYPAIEYLRSFNFSNCDVFEFGAGNSSLFWAQRSRSIVSVEDNAEWFLYVSSMTLDNQSVIHQSEEEDYVKSLSDQGKLFQVIAIDGKWRSSCVVEAVKYLDDGGLIVLDNSDRLIEKESCRFLRAHGYFQIDFSGFGPINGYCWTTSIFIKTPTFLQQGFTGPEPIGGQYTRAD